jgi:hypothetical protein
MNNLKIKGRFKVYNHLVVGDDKNIYQLSHFIGKRTMSFRKLKYYIERNAYGYNGSYISKNRLIKLYYNSEETVNKLESKNFIL